MSQYVSYQEYIERGGAVLPADSANRYLAEASCRVDILTFNRIVVRDFGKLTTFQKEKVRDVVCKFADFMCENEDLVNNYLSSYSINGVSVDFAKTRNLAECDGVVIPRMLLSELATTGLCYRGVGR